MTDKEDRGMMLDLAYMICTTPRTGATSLVDCLRRSGVAGQPAEYPEAEPYQGIYGVMVHMNQLHYGFKLPEAVSYRYIHLYRDNVPAQAVSWVIASQTNQWQSNQPTNKKPRYSFKTINRGIQRIYLDNYGWSVYLEHQPHVLSVSYESLSIDYSEETKKILKFLDLPEVTVAPTLHKVGTRLNDEWVERWKERR